MLAAHSCIRTITVPHRRSFSDPTNATPPIASCSFVHYPIRLDLRSIRTKRRPPPYSILISCNSSRGSSGSRSNPADVPDGEFLKASLLISETISHHRMLRKKSRGFQEVNWQSSKKLLPYIPKSPRSEISPIGQGIIRSFRSPTIFLKVSCDGEFLLPILVGEYAIDCLMDASWGEDTGESPDQYQFVRNMVQKLGYEVKWVTITERVMNTYFAKLYLGKPGDSQIISVDARPSDAINVVYKCKAPIYVNRKVVLADAIRIDFGTGRVRYRKPSYDVSLDSAVDGPDSLSEELEFVMNMELAIQEERYDDAVMWREKLMKLRKSQDDH